MDDSTIILTLGFPGFYLKNHEKFNKLGFYGLIIASIGYILFGISALQTNSYPKIPLWFLIIGAPVFGNGIAFPIRTIGLLLFCIGTIWISRSIQKNENNTVRNRA